MLSFGRVGTTVSGGCVARLDGLDGGLGGSGGLGGGLGGGFGGGGGTGGGRLSSYTDVIAAQAMSDQQFLGC
jgi:hypothetical protein